MQPEGGHLVPVAPAYGEGCVTGLVPALMEGDLVAGGWPSWIPDEVLGARRTLLLVLDGLGWEQLQERRSTGPDPDRVRRRSNHDGRTLHHGCQPSPPSPQASRQAVMGSWATGSPSVVPTGRPTPRC